MLGTLRFRQKLLERLDCVRQKHALIVETGTDANGKPITVRTPFIAQGKFAFLTFKIPKSQLASTTPYRLTVPGVDGQEIKLVVP